MSVSGTLKRCIIAGSHKIWTIYMKKYLILIFTVIFACFLTGCPCYPGNTTRDFVRIGTYNLQNFFDDADDPHKSDGEAPPEERIGALAEIILAAKCDILAVQEVENIGVLEDFNRHYLQNYYSHAFLVEGNDPRGIDVGFLSKYPFHEVASYRDRIFVDPDDGSEFSFPRDLLVVQWSDPTGNQWNFITTHLKSGRSSDDVRARELETIEIRQIIHESGCLSAGCSGRIILLGDLNAEPWTSEMRILADIPFSDPARDLRNRYTHVSGKILDYILLSPEADTLFKIGSYTILRDFPAEMASDHFLVYLDLYI